MAAILLTEDDASDQETTVDRRGDATLGGALAGISALVISLLIGIAFAPYRDTVGLENVAILYVALVAIAGVAGGRTGGLVAALVAALSYNFFFTTPYNSLRIDSTGQVITVALLFSAGALASLAGHLERRLARRRVVRALRREALAVEVVADALGARTRGEDPARVSVEAIRRLLQARAVAEVDPDDLAAPARARSGDGLPADLSDLSLLDERGLEALAQREPFGSDPALPSEGIVLLVATGPASRVAYAILPEGGHAVSRSVRTAVVTIAAELHRPSVQT